MSTILTKRIAIIFAAAAITLMFLSRVYGQPDNRTPDAPSAEQIALARDHYALGKKAHDAKDYSTAAEEYIKAYEIYPQPLFLYNVGQVKRLAADDEGAIEFYERYLAQDPDGPGVANTKRLLVELHKSVLEAKKAKEKQEKSNQKKLPIEPIIPVVVSPEITLPIAPKEIVVPPPPPKKTENPGRGLKIAGASTAIIGILALGVSGFYGAKALSKNDEINTFKGVWTPENDSLYDDGESADTRMMISAGLGGAALVTGAVLYFLGTRKNSSERISVAPTLSDTQTGVSVSGSF